MTGFSMLAHTASREGEVAVNNILGKKDRMRYDAIPGVVYTNPEVAGVGLTEEQAKASGKEYVIVKLPMAYSGRFVAENEGGEGICKCCMAIETEMTLEQMREVVFPHPTVSEILKETAFSFK